MTRVLALGDVCPAQIGRDRFAESRAYAALREELRQFPGCVVANLECALAHGGRANRNKVALAASPEVLGQLDFVDVFCLANNHISDLGPDGVAETIAAIESRGAYWFGYGETLEEARRPLRVERDGHTLGFLGYSCLTTNGENYASADREGVAPIALEYLEADIRALRGGADAVLVFLHWGVENRPMPTPDQVRVARRAIELGADAVIGTHPHVIQGSELHRGKPIHYSLGNFMFSDLEYEVIEHGQPRTRTLAQQPLNRESIGSLLEVTGRGEVRRSGVRGFALGEDFLPGAVEVASLASDVAALDRRLARETSRHRFAIRAQTGLRIGQDAGV